MTVIRVLAAAAMAALIAAPALAQDAAPAPTAAPSDWRTVPADALLVIDTNRGRILVEMAPEAAPDNRSHPVVGVCQSPRYICP